MGRKKKGSNTQNEVDSFSVDKDEQLTVFSRKDPLTITDDVIKKYPIKPVRKTSDLRGEFLEAFTGKSYDDSLALAYDWAKRFNDKSSTRKIELVDYFPQSFKGKNILLSYKILENVQ